MEGQQSPSHVVFVCDATKDRHENELKLVVNGIRLRGDILRGGNTLIVLGIMHKVMHPMGYLTEAYSDSFAGPSIRAMEEEICKKLNIYVNMLLQSAEDCEAEGVKIEVKITAGSPMKKAILQEVARYRATWVILDRHLRRDFRFYIKQIPWKLAFIEDNLSVEIMRPYTLEETGVIEQKSFYSLSKIVPVLDSQDYENVEQFGISVGSSYSSVPSSIDTSSSFKNSSTSSYIYRSHDHSFSSHDDVKSTTENESSDISVRGHNKNPTAVQIYQKQRKIMFRHRSSGAPILCAACGMRTELYIKDSAKFSYSVIQQATNDFSRANLLGEGGYGYVYQGQLNDGQMIAAKVRKEESAQGFEEFHSEIYVLNFARHKNIVMLLGYCSRENQNILVYEFICNKSLEWHLFDRGADVLQWHHRHAIALGTAKGLRFLHDECRGGPIIHRDMRPSNILLTHDFVPMLGDFGLAKWKTSEDSLHTRILGTLGYLAPEYAESGIVSVRTDVYAYGIVVLQLISGLKVFNSKDDGQNQSLRQWGMPLIKKLALHELIDPRIGNSYDTYELYLMARTAYLCVQTDPELRPSMAEVIRLLEGESGHYRYLSEQFVPHYTK